MGVVLDARNIPHLYVNGTDQGELTSFPLDDDCYAMFCLHCEKRQVSDAGYISTVVSAYSKEFRALFLRQPPSI